MTVYQSGQGPRVAVVGAGISGLGAAWWLARHGAQPTLFEREARLGGHAHTVDVTLPGPDGRLVTHGVDTGFLVYNERTYPRLIELFRTLGVATAETDMSFSVQSDRGLDGRPGRLEWSGSNLDTVFAQRGNLLSPRFWGMLRDILRFNKLATALARQGADADMAQPLAAFLQQHRFSAAFIQGYLLPMIACIWSCPLEQMLQFPVGTLVRFCDNHGLLQVADRPRWRTVKGGSAHYVQAIAAGLRDVRLGQPVLGLRRLPGAVELDTTLGTERFDAVILACHAPQALALLGGDASAAEGAVLGAMRTQRNWAVLHTDASVMPRHRKAWAAWNHEHAADADLRAGVGGGTQALPVCLHYWINRLQPLPFARDVFVSLNPLRPLATQAVLGRYAYEHPVFDVAAVAAQRRLLELQGEQRTWFAGAWCGHGFHEDGLKAGLAAAQDVAARLGLGAANRMTA